MPDPLPGPTVRVLCGAHLWSPLSRPVGADPKCKVCGEKVFGAPGTLEALLADGELDRLLGDIVKRLTYERRTAADHVDRFVQIKDRGSNRFHCIDPDDLLAALTSRPAETS